MLQSLPALEGRVASSGERLRAVSSVAEGGLQAVTGFYDSVLRTNCEPQWIGEGYKCMPPRQSTTVYGDAGCMRPLIRPSSCEGSFIYRYDPRMPCAPSRLWRSTSTAFTGATSYTLTSSAGGAIACTPMAGAVPTGYYEMEELPVKDLADIKVVPPVGAP
jgi:hypothetical protein